LSQRSINDQIAEIVFNFVKLYQSGLFDYQERLLKRIEGSPQHQLHPLKHPPNKERAMLKSAKTYKQIIEV
jgi:hypothetical protein